LQFFARYENWSFANLGGIEDQEIDWSAAGVNYFLKDQDLRLTFEYSFNDFEREDPDDPNTEDFSTATVMLQFRF
jgi:hypothetical protein